MIFIKIKVLNPLEVPLKTMKIMIKKELGILKLSKVIIYGSVASAKIKHQVLN